MKEAYLKVKLGVIVTRTILTLSLIAIYFTNILDVLITRLNLGNTVTDKPHSDGSGGDVLLSLFIFVVIMIATQLIFSCINEVIDDSIKEFCK